MKNQTKLIVLGIIAVILLVATLITVNVEVVKGNQIAVLETWGGGVEDETLSPRTYVYIPGFMYDVIPYPAESEVFVMNDLTEKDDEWGQGRKKDSYEVQTADQQTVKVSCRFSWIRDKEKLPIYHVKVNNHAEERRIRPALERAIKNSVTSKTALDVYSGAGLVEVQNSIEEELQNDPFLTSVGIIAEKFTITSMDLNTNYVAEIEARQLAIQSEKRAQQEEQAALAEAQKAKAEAQADYEKTLVEAERDKQKGILEAQKEAEQQVLRAEAQKKESVLAAEAKKESDELEAIGILARGQAEAEAKKLQLQAYAVEGADSFVKIEVSKNMSEAFKNVSGYLPEDMNINVLTGSFLDGLKSVVGPKLVQ